MIGGKLSATLLKRAETKELNLHHLLWLASRLNDRNLSSGVVSDEKHTAVASIIKEARIKARPHPGTLD